MSDATTTTSPAINRDAVRQYLQDQLEVDKYIKDQAEALGKLDSYKARSYRELLWDIFSEQVVHHVGTYTVPQYGDFPDDQLSDFTEADIKTQIHRYVNRMDTNARGDIEAMRDLFKICHYCSELYVRKLGFVEELNAYLEGLEAEDHDTADRPDELVADTTEEVMETSDAC